MDEDRETKIAGFNFWLDLSVAIFSPGNMQASRI
jgi:hypothetical protein